MKADELKSAAIEIFGERGWSAALAGALGIERTQVWRYINSVAPIPGPVSAAVTAWQKQFQIDGTKPPAQPK